MNAQDLTFGDHLAEFGVKVTTVETVGAKVVVQGVDDETDELTRHEFNLDQDVEVD